MKTIKELKARLREIGVQAKEVAPGDVEKLNALLAEARDIEAKIAEAEDRARLQQIADDAAEGAAQTAGEGAQNPQDTATKRGNALKAGGKVKRSFGVKNTITSSSTVMTQHTANDVLPGFNPTSSLADRVRIVPLPGGESYKRGFVKSYGTGDYTAEGAAAATAEPVFGYAEMTKTKITAYCEEPEEIAKLAPADYDRAIGDSVEVAVRKKLNIEIMKGTGGAGKLYGIFYNPTSTADDIIDRNTDLSISAIDENTLDDIIYNYGGDENVEDAAVLILNKQDLKAFAKCRKTNGDKAYKVVNNGNTGYIDGVSYIINSACAAVTAAATAAGTYCMAYGHLSHYEMPVFSDMEVQRSTEYKFKEGQIAHKGEIFAGGNVASYNGFIRVKKAAASSTTGK